jgi:hypothetical protein
MAAIPTPDQEDARRPNRERENLIGQQTRIINRMKACLVRWGIRSFKPTLRHLAMVNVMLKEIDEARDAAAEASAAPSIPSSENGQRLVQLKGIGPQSCRCPGYGGVLSRVQEPSLSGQLSRSYAESLSKWRHGSGPRDHEGRESSSEND